MGGSGGGVSGEVSFPAYIEDIHEDWLYGSGPSALSTTVEDAMDVAFAGDPYSGYSFTNPTSGINVVQGDYDTWYSAISGSVTTTDYKALIDVAQAKADECDINKSIDVRTVINREIENASSSLEEAVFIAKQLVEGDIITSLVESYESTQSRAREQRVGRYTAAMADFGALRSSAFLTGLGSIYAQEQEDTARYTKEVSAQLFQQGIQAWVQNYSQGLRVSTGLTSVNKQSRQQTLQLGLQSLTTMYQQRLDNLGRAAQIQAEINRLAYVQTREYEIAELDLDVKSALWDMDIFGRGTSIMGGLSGYAHPLPDGPSKAASALGGALSGAATGAAIGSAVPGLGTGVGAAIGAGIGFLGGLFS